MPMTDNTPQTISLAFKFSAASVEPFGKYVLWKGSTIELEVRYDKSWEETTLRIL